MNNDYSRCSRRFARTFRASDQGKSVATPPITAPANTPLIPTAVPISAKPMLPTRTPMSVAPIAAPQTTSWTTKGSLRKPRQIVDAINPVARASVEKSPFMHVEVASRCKDGKPHMQRRYS